jgi:Cd2+/Zn2+-exporting ATPase
VSVIEPVSLDLEHGLQSAVELTERQQRWVMNRLIGTFLGGALILNAYLVDWIVTDSQGIGSLCALLGTLLLAAPLFRHSIRNLSTGRLDMDELASLGIIACVSLADYKTGGVVAFFMLMAKLIQQRTALGAHAAIEELLRLTPRTACLILPDGSERTVSVADLALGQHVRVRPGDNFPADGRILSGETTINEASITGESLPVDKGAGQQVFAGTANLTGAVDVEVTRLGPDTTLGRVKNLIFQAERTRSPIMRIIDRHSQWYTPTMLMVVGVILFFTRDMNRAISALVVACPVAFILATPTAMIAALSCAARLGILVKDVADIEGAARTNAIVFDKTGTLTTGNLVVARLAPAEGFEAERLLTLAASAESGSNHPVARAVQIVAREAALSPRPIESFREVPGKGVEARTAGHDVLVGRESWLREREGVDLAAWDVLKESVPAGLSLLLVVVDGRWAGWLGLEDQTRPEAHQAAEELRELGIRRLVMLTGDKWDVAHKVSAELGCTDVQAECLPETKLDAVAELKSEGYYVTVVGDGINDAPALAAGDIGVAMGAAGSDVAINSASIALMSSDLARLPFLVRLSRRARRAVSENLLVGLGFMAVGLALSATGVMTPIWAALLHNVSSFVVIFNSARLVRLGEHLTPFAETRSPEPESQD